MKRAYLYTALPTALILATLFYVVLLVAPVGAGDQTPRFSETVEVTASADGFTYQKLVRIATELVKILLQIAELAAVGAVVYYGLRMVMSGGDPTKFSAAKKGLGLAILGALVIFGVYTIIATIQSGVQSVGN